MKSFDMEKAEKKLSKPSDKIIMYLVEPTEQTNTAISDQITGHRVIFLNFPFRISCKTIMTPIILTLFGGLPECSLPSGVKALHKVEMDLGFNHFQ